jgi:4,5-DOPA dioxygenase extradiol
MIALETNATTRAWRALAEAMPRPRAILCISAHWLTRGSAVTAMPAPRTIHDFGAFPRALFEVRYPAPGDPDLARSIRDLLSPVPVALDHGWGLDHGCWSVLCKAYPEADVPVVEFSMDADLDDQGRFDLGRRLGALRDEGVLILGTGNIVHNLPAMDMGARDGAPFPWASRFNEAICDAIRWDAPERVVGYAALGADARLAAPTPEHFWPLQYVLGARRPGEAAAFITDHIEHRSLSMTGVVFGQANPHQREAA